MTAARNLPAPSTFRNHARHPWHLVRCHECRKMIMNSTPKCPHCAAWQPDARVFSITFTAVAGLLCAATLVIATGWYIRELIVLPPAEGATAPQVIQPKITGP
ncbi:MAG TPA: hypothetical protein VHH73_18565 [Verrucomicrobiae bacterium]|nr:hypothetical protein [Verrucomicrobiae bacterium]